MARATWNGALIAESDDTTVVEGNHYFPRESVRFEHLRETETRTVCGWKGEARYYTIVVEGKANADAAWSYPDPKPEAKQIAGKLAFWKGVEVAE